MSCIWMRIVAVVASARIIVASSSWNFSTPNGEAIIIFYLVRLLHWQKVHATKYLRCTSHNRSCSLPIDWIYFCILRIILCNLYGLAVSRGLLHILSSGLCSVCTVTSDHSNMYWSKRSHAKTIARHSLCLSLLSVDDSAPDANTTDCPLCISMAPRPSFASHS